MDEWDELFAKASGSQDVSFKEPATTQMVEKKTSRKRKHRRGAGDAYDAFLESRWETATRWPMSSQCFQLKGSFDFMCSGFQAEDDFRCLKCTQPAYEHALSLSNDRKHMWWMEVLCDLWNVRHASKSAALCLVSNSAIKWTNYAAIFRKSQLSLKATMARNNDLEPLTSYMDELLPHLKIFTHRKSSAKTTPYETFSGAVQLIILCDKVYYQLYYLQLTKAIPFAEQHAIPHPTEYFAAACFEDQAPCQIKVSDRTSELNILGWDPLFRDKTSAFHPLLALHWYRRIEGASLFRTAPPGTLNDSEITLWRQPLVPVLSAEPSKPDDDSKLAKHETLAPMLLKQWRDSCRDFLCHLYAYATLNLSSLPKIRSFLRETTCTGITEIGAGTGYLAGWLERNGVKVQAYDIAPTAPKGNQSLINEYHGQTPSFGRVDVCETKSSRAFVFDKEQALLLCYPPPDSLMAFETLRNFLAQGGHAVIHVGEWKGLTGTSKFENLLLENMKLVDRLACSTWGTDASEISLWERAKQSGSLMIPCSSCYKIGATKRCRLLRSLNYCSEECCRNHQRTRDFLFSLLMIDSNAVKIDFDDDSTFQILT